MHVSFYIYHEYSLMFHPFYYLGGNFVQFTGAPFARSTVHSSGRLDCRGQSLSMEIRLVYSKCPKSIRQSVSLEW
jgi:hypothetical protein